MSPWILVSPMLKIFSSTGGQILWQLYMVKFSGTSSFWRGTHVEGAVVSKPTETNARSFFCSLAILTASSME